MNSVKYIPALRWNWLTRLFDPLISLTMPEQKFKMALIEQAAILPHHRILDFGIGTATLSLMIKETKPSSEVTGVDVDEKILSIAAKKIKKAKAKIFITKYDGVKLPYSESCFDRVLTSLVFHHLTAEQKHNSLVEIKRVLKPNGELHIADWGKASSVLMRSLFFFVQLLDGFKTTNDNIKGLMPAYIENAGFKKVEVKRNYSTIFGTLTLYKAIN
ncbi:MAG: class I SAM-dependent methyltransferase [Sphingobacteriales bacterium]|nr:class I SAM-dependent methyltransferase [Sphingobacteriales bacterium]